MIVLEGQPALSQFRRARLESKLQSLVPEVRIRGAWYVYFIDADASAKLDQDTLCRILQAHGQPEPLAADGVSRFVVPRLGTLSPWASKATDRKSVV